MNPKEKGFLLLTSHLGNPGRKPLTQAQLKQLAARIRLMEEPEEERELERRDLIAFGYGREMAERILALLEEEDVLNYYLSGANGCIPIPRCSENYPALLRYRLGDEAPGCLWARGDTSILKEPAVSLVGSRDLKKENRDFAAAVGTMAAENGLVLVSGNARGADRTAQEACLAAGGKVISIVADDLSAHSERRGVLYLSEDGYGELFSTQRALSRNRFIHALGQVTFVAQAALGKGGTWDGTVKNLRHGWSTVAFFRDGSPASLELEQMGAYLIGLEELQDFDWIPMQEPGFFT